MCIRKLHTFTNFTLVQSNEYGTGHPVKCGPAARKTGIRPALAVERAKASLGITSPVSGVQ